MSTLSSQADKLRTLADELRSVRFDGEYISNVETLYLAMVAMREAADTIMSLRDSLNEVADKWAEAQIKAEDYARENMLLKRDNDTRWHELFGTPERAARYFAMQCFGSDGGMCYYCPFDDCDEKLRNSGAYPTVYDALLEWLEGVDS